MSLNPLTHLWFTSRTIGLPLMLRSVRYNFEKEYHELKYADPLNPQEGPKLWLNTLLKVTAPDEKPPSFEEFDQPGAVKSWYQEKDHLTLSCENGSIRLTVFAPNLVQVRLAQKNNFPKPFSYAVEKPASEWSPPKLEVTETENTIQLKTSQLSVEINKHNSLIDFLDALGHPIEQDSGGMGWHDNWVGLKRQLNPDMPILGLGGRAAPFNHYGQRYEMWNRDPNGTYDPGHDPLYQSHPWFIGMNWRNGKRAFGLFFDNTYRSFFDMGKESPTSYNIVAKNGELRYYFIYGPEIKTVLNTFTKLVGRMPMPPLWSLGLQQSRWSYKNEAVVRQLAADYRAREIPCDAIYLDLAHMHSKRSFTWHKRNFAAPKKLVQDLRTLGFRLITISNPGIRADKMNDVAEDGLKHNVFLKYPDGKLFQGPVWPGDCYFPDFTNPAVRIWWGKQFQAQVEIGISGYWNDMNEPAVFSPRHGTVPNPVPHSLEGKGATHDRVHNIYGMQMARATQRGLTALNPKRRPFVLSRAGFTGIHRYAAVWTGDNGSTWEHLRMSLDMILNYGLSGQPFAGADVGGFRGKGEPELFARWMQLGALLPLYRIHTAIFTPPQEPWMFGPRIEAIARQAIETRYRLLPYLYTAFYQAHRTGLPVARPLLMNFQDDPHTRTLDDQFMVGDSLMVAPVMHRNIEARSVYLPQGIDWYDYWTGEHHRGGQILDVEAPLEKWPLFVKAGSVIPEWPLLQHTNQRHKLKTLNLHFYVGKGESELYEDDGRSFEYQHGEKRHTTFICRPRAKEIILTTRQKGQYLPPYDTFNWVVQAGFELKPKQILVDGLSLDNWQAGKLENSINFTTPWFQRLEIHL